MRKFRKFGKIQAIFLKEKGKKKMSRAEWLQHRQLGLGGSDMGTLMDMNPRYSKMELFYQKLGLNFSTDDEDNSYMYWGRRLEKSVIEAGQYLDFSSQEYIDNDNNGNPLRKASPLPIMAMNPEYPWLLANIDGVEGWNRSYTYPKIDALAEAKTISRRAREMWAGGLPPYYIAQAVMYATVFQPIMRKDSKINIYILEDGSDFTGIDLNISQNKKLQNIQGTMLNKSYDFWNRLIMGKAIIAKYADWEDSREAKHEMMQELSEVEPEIDASPAYEQFYSDFYVSKMELLRHELEGNQEIWEMGVDYLNITKLAKEVKAKRDLLAHRIKDYLKNWEAYSFTFGDMGKIMFNKRLYVNIKPTEKKDES